MRITKNILRVESGREYRFTLREEGYHEQHVARVYEVKSFLGIKYYSLVAETYIEISAYQEGDRMLALINECVIGADSIVEERELEKKKARITVKRIRHWDGKV